MESLLQRKLAAGEFVVSVEIDPPRGANPQAMLDIARTLKDSGTVDVVDVNDNPRARARMSGVMASVAIERRVGIETIPHLTPRDSSIAGLESTLLGAHAEGIRNVLAVTGDPPEAGDYPGAQGVYEVDSIGLSKIITQMNAGEDFNGAEIDAPTSFFLGVAVNPAADDLDFELGRFEQKLEAGAKLRDDAGPLRPRATSTASSNGSVASARFPCSSGSSTSAATSSRSGSTTRYRESWFRTMCRSGSRIAGKDAGDVGLELAKDLLDACRERAAGVYVIPPFRQPLAALDVLA